jgi:hypothetical protein
MNSPNKNPRIGWSFFRPSIVVPAVILALLPNSLRAGPNVERLDVTLKTISGDALARYAQQGFTLDLAKYPAVTNAPMPFQQARSNDGTWSDTGRVLGFRFAGFGRALTTADSTISCCSALDATGKFSAVGYGTTLTDKYDYVALFWNGEFGEDDDCVDSFTTLLAEWLGIPPGSVDSYLWDITPDGQTAVGNYHDSSYKPWPLIIRTAALEAIAAAPFPSGITDGQVTAVSDNGLIFYGYGSLGTDTSNQNLISWTRTSLTDPLVATNLGKFPGSIGTYTARCSPNGTFVTGEALDSSYRGHAYEYSAANAFVDLGASAPVGSQFGQAYTVNSAGSLAVGYGASGAYGYKWTPTGGIAPLYPLSGLVYSVSQCMSSDGVFFGGGSYDASFATAGAQLWTEGGESYNLQGLLSVAGINLASWQLRQVTSIVMNSDGSYLLTGNGTHNGIAEGWAAQISIQPTVFSAHPQNQAGVIGGQVSFSVLTNLPGSPLRAAESSAPGSGTNPRQAGSPAPSLYQWQHSTNGGASWRKLHDTGAYSGTATSTLTLNPVNTSMNGHLYRCMVQYDGGQGVPQTETSHAATLTVPVGAAGDFNGDGKTDITWQNTVTGDNYLWLMGGTTYLSSAYLGNLSTQWRIGGRADFNNDGKSDIVWQNLATGDRYVWLMNGTGYGSSVYLGNIDPQWRIVGTGDFNGDGYADLLWENVSTGDRYLWRMNGTAFQSSRYLGNIPTAWHIAGTGDFNGDGSVDILWENTSTGERYLWFMNGTAFSSAVSLGIVPTNWSIAGTGDFNGDGKPDIIWQNTSTGERVIWLMNGATYQSSVYLTVISTDWSIRD